MDANTTVVATQLDGLRYPDGPHRTQLHLSMADSSTRWAWARIVNVSPEMVATNHGVIPFIMQFQVASVLEWHGTR